MCIYTAYTYTLFTQKISLLSKKFKFLSNFQVSGGSSKSNLPMVLRKIYIQEPPNFYSKACDWFGQKFGEKIKEILNEVEILINLFSISYLCLPVFQIKYFIRFTRGCTNPSFLQSRFSQILRKQSRLHFYKI